MEASTAVPAAAEGQPTEGQEAEPQEQAGIESWQESVNQQLSQSNAAMQQMAEMNQSILSRLPEPQQEQTPDFDQQYADLFEANGGYVDPSQLQGLVQEQARSIAQEMIAPLQQQLQAHQQQMTAQDLESLQGEFPELGDQKAADGLADSVVSAAFGMVPQGLDPAIAEKFVDGLVHNKAFVRQVHLAGKAERRAREETPAGQGQNVPQIETGGGAAPTSTSGADEWDSFVNSRQRNSVFGS